jgi:hypothetical protein
LERNVILLISLTKKVKEKLLYEKYTNERNILGRNAASKVLASNSTRREIKTKSCKDKNFMARVDQSLAPKEIL